MLARAKPLRWLGAALLALAARGAAAAECAPPSGLSPCIDADPVWLTPDSRLFFVPASGPRPGTRLELAFTRVSRPIALKAPAPDPDGREVPVLEREFGASLMAGHGLSRRVALELVLPLVLDRRGTGIEGVTSSSAAPPPRSSLRDPRAGLSFALLARRAPLGFEVSSRFDVSLPAGDERHFAGERSVVGQPSLVMTARRGPVFAASSTGLRLRQPVELADARFGTALWVSVGAGLSVLGEQRLVTALEAYIAPPLVRAGRGAQVDRAQSLVPAEWLFSLRLRPHPAAAVHLGAGSGLPLSTRTAADGGVERYTAPTSPAWRAVGSVTLSLSRARTGAAPRD